MGIIAAVPISKAAEFPHDKPKNDKASMSKM